jgi:hypothetical protein
MTYTRKAVSKKRGKDPKKNIENNRFKILGPKTAFSQAEFSLKADLEEMFRERVLLKQLFAAEEGRGLAVPALQPGFLLLLFHHFLILFLQF